MARQETQPEKTATAAHSLSTTTPARAQRETEDGPQFTFWCCASRYAEDSLGLFSEIRTDGKVVSIKKHLNARSSEMIKLFWL